MEFVHSAPDRDQNLYLLLDGALLEAPRFIYTHDDNPGFDQLYRGTPHEVVREVSPCIVKPSEGSRLWDRANDWQAAGIALESREDIYTVGNHLRSLLSVQLPDGALAYLRYYSPGQIAALFSAFTPGEASRFSGTIEKWHYFASTHGWQTVDVPEIGQSREADEEGWFQLSQEHINAIETHDEAAFIQSLVRQAGLSGTPKDLSVMEQLVAQGRALGFRTRSDLANYTELSIHYEQRLRQPGAQAILEDTTRPAPARLEEIDRLIAYGGA